MRGMEKIVALTLVILIGLTVTVRLTRSVSVTPVETSTVSILDTVLEKSINMLSEHASATPHTVLLIVGEHHIYIVRLSVYNSIRPGDNVLFKCITKSVRDSHQPDDVVYKVKELIANDHGSLKVPELRQTSKEGD